MLMDMQQGFGRLIRSEKDTGVFALLDSRANSKGYGSDIIAALPKMGRVVLEGDRESRPEPEVEDY
jgi:Rad3-related DNA helicase